MPFFTKNTNTTQQPAGNQNSLPVVSITKEEAEVLLVAIKQSVFKGEHAKAVASLIEKFEQHIVDLS